MSDKYCDEEEENGRVETLVKTIDRIELLEKQLAIAIKALDEYADRENWYNIYDQDTLDVCPLSRADRWKNEYGYKPAQKALEKIKNVQPK